MTPEEKTAYFREYHRKNSERINKRRLSKVPCPLCGKMISRCNLRAHLERPRPHNPVKKNNKTTKLQGTRWKNIIVPVINVRSPVGAFPTQG